MNKSVDTTYTEAIKPGQALIICPPPVVGAICGVKYAKRESNGKTTLIYADDTEESAVIPTLRDPENFFAIVGDVQSIARRQ